MTLVLSALTRHEVIQISDRRFTYLQSGRAVRHDDEKNKAVLFCGRLIFGFTGFGDLGLERQTDLWLATRICETVGEANAGDQGALLQGVARKCTALFKKLRYRGHRHAFVSVGWAHFRESTEDQSRKDPAYRPYLALISNFHDASGCPTSAVADEFAVWIRPLQEDEGGFVLDVPGHLSREETEQLTSQLAAADRSRDRHAMVEAMASQILKISARDSHVGRGLMISAIPRAALGSLPGILAVANEPLDDAQTFLYVPPSGDTTTQLGPVTTCGYGITSGFRAEPLPDGFEIPHPEHSSLDEPAGLIRRWYLAPIVGEGTMEQPYEALTLGRGGAAVISTGKDGRPKHRWCLVLVSSQDHSELEGHPDILPIADLLDLDLEIDDLPAAKKSWIEDVVKQRGASPATLVRDLVRQLGQELDPAFDETNFWIR